MANYYCAASFELPQTWPREAKEMFLDLVQGVVSSNHVSELEDIFAKYEIEEEFITPSQLMERYYSMEWEIYKTKQNKPLPKEEWEYVFYNVKYFDPDTTETLLELVTTKFKIPYQDRLEVNYCWSCDDPRIDAFGGSKIIAYYEPLENVRKGYIKCESVEDMKTRIKEIHDDYAEQISNLNASEEIKDSLHIVLNAMTDTNIQGLTVLDHEKPKYRIILTNKDIYTTLCSVRRTLETKENTRRNSNENY